MHKIANLKKHHWIKIKGEKKYYCDQCGFFKVWDPDQYEYYFIKPGFLNPLKSLSICQN
jgi:hypothetical protein